MSEWKTYKWGDLISLEYGKPIPDKNLLDGQYPVYGTNGRIGTSNLTPLCKHPSIIVGRKGAYRGVHYSNKPFSVIDTAFFVEPKTSILDLKWAYYKLLTVNINKMDSGSAIPSTDRYEIYSLSVELPPLDEQRRIAGILGSLDDKIELNRRLNANLEAQAQALFRSWFVDFEPFCDGPFVDSELGKIPQGWEIGTLSEIADITMGQSPKGSSYNEEGNGIIFYQGRAEFGNRFPSIRLYTTEPTRIAEINSVLLSVRAPVGDINIAKNTCCIGRGLAAIKSKHGCNSFILYLLQSLKPLLEQYNGEGTVFGCINRKEIEGLPIIIPKESIINEFEEIVEKIDSEIKNLTIEQENLSALRDTLLPKLMAGEINVE